MLDAENSIEQINTWLNYFYAFVLLNASEFYQGLAPRADLQITCSKMLCVL